MYTITINNTPFSEFEDFDQAVGLAVNLHKSSNKEHSICVFKDEKTICYFFS